MLFFHAAALLFLTCFHFVNIWSLENRYLAMHFMARTDHFFYFFIFSLTLTFLRSWYISNDKMWYFDSVFSHIYHWFFSAFKPIPNWAVVTLGLDVLYRCLRQYIRINQKNVNRIFVSIVNLWAQSDRQTAFTLAEFCTCLSY